MRRATEKDLFGPRGGAAVQQRRLQASANGGVVNKEPQLSRAAEVRKVEAAIGVSGMDISQKYDAFGNNSFSSADNPWMAFFGAPTAPWKTTSYDKYDRHNYSLPEAYVGQNKTLAQTIDELIYNEETFYTTELLPFSFTDQISVQWDKIEFNEHFTGIVPEQGVSRLVSSHRTQHSESFLRRGLAAIFEHGFMSTPQGRANYFLTLAQIARAVQETINFGVIYAYLTCHNYAKQWEEKHGYFRSQTLAELLERDNFMWAIAVKTGKHCLFTMCLAVSNALARRIWHGEAGRADCRVDEPLPRDRRHVGAAAQAGHVPPPGKLKFVSRAKQN